MNESRDIKITKQLIASYRGKKKPVDTYEPYGFLSEPERTYSGEIKLTGVVFLTNKECRFRCLMCDLWKNTTDVTVPAGAIPIQIEKALAKMPGIRQLKLYNSGSFFDPGSIPPGDYPSIASLLEGLDTVIVESHPKLTGRRCTEFKKLLKPDLEVAMGLETVNPKVLRLLNKGMTTDDFRRAASFLTSNGIRTRAFILLRPPFMNEDEGVYWAIESIKFAFASGVDCCTIIPVRGGNGIMEVLSESGHFHPPSITSIERVLEQGISLNKGRVFADTWDINLFSSCQLCTGERKKRIDEMNIRQVLLPPVKCSCNGYIPRTERLF